MITIKRTFAQSVGSLINLKPKNDYKAYTSVATPSFNAMLNDMRKVGKDLKKATNSYDKNKTYSSR